jgi:oxamate amidohydrolase
MAVAPHALASQSALAVLREGGNAVEAMVAAAATIAVAYPHMNGIGGDSFWLVGMPGASGTEVVGIDACGAGAARTTPAARPSRSAAARPRSPWPARCRAGTRRWP